MAELEDELKQYVNPKEAKAIWDEYLPDINALSCYNDALNILTNTRRASALDIKLSRLLSNRERNSHR